MSDKPILFSGPMVRAILEGRKTQTRRVIKHQPHEQAKGCYHRPDGSWVWLDAHRENNGPGYNGNRLDDRHFFTPYAPGDRLWVREAWRTDARLDSEKPRDLVNAPIRMEADGEICRPQLLNEAGKLRPSMFMPRWASRLTLIVTDVRVQRLQEITEGDAKSEGIIGAGLIWGIGVEPPDPARAYSPVSAFKRLWDSLNADRGYGWDENPWVAAYTFTAHKCNIDKMEGANA